MPKLLWLGAFLLGFSWLNTASAQNDPFRVKVNQEEISANQSFRVSFKLKGKGRDFEPPAFRYFDVVWGPAKSVKRRIVNGNFSMTQSYTYKLKPKRKGSFQIGSAKVVKDGKTLTTDPVSIEVSKGKKPSDQQAGNDESITERIKEKLYIKCNVNNRNPYRGQQIRATYKLYINVGITDYEVKETPQFNGFWKEMLKDPEKFNIKRERIDGERFKTAVLSKVALFPQRSGKLKLDPFEMKFDVRYRDRSNDGGFYSRLRRNFKTKTLKISSHPVTINVKPLPDSPPSSFSGLVGQFNLSSELDQEQTMLNKPVSLKLRIAGRGNLNKTQPLDLSIPPVFDTYDPEVNSHINTKKGHVQGAKTFEYLLMPRSPGQHKIDPIKFTYFDPVRETYMTETTDPYTIRVSPKASGNDTSIAGKDLITSQQPVKSIEKDIRYIKTNSNDIPRQPVAFVFSAPFWGLTIAPFLLVGGMVYWRKQQGATSAVPRANQAKMLAQRQLKNAYKAQKSGDQETFYEALSWALWGYAGDKLNIPVAEMTQDELEKRFKEKAVNHHLIQDLLSLIQQCEAGAYTPNGGPSDVSDLYKKAESLITSLEAELR